MHVDSIRELLAECTPLAPVLVYLADGTSFKVGHADYFTFSRGYRTLVLSDRGGRETWIDTALIARAELMERD